MMDSLKLYARREPDRRYAMHGYSQIALYRPGEAWPVAVYPFHFENRPTKRQSRISHNCARYDLEWLPDLIGPPVDVGALRLRAIYSGKSH